MSHLFVIACLEFVMTGVYRVVLADFRLAVEILISFNIILLCN
jgi:hypothetical protein